MTTREVKRAARAIDTIGGPPEHPDGLSIVKLMLRVNERQAHRIAGYAAIRHNEHILTYGKPILLMHASYVHEYQRHLDLVRPAPMALLRYAYRNFTLSNPTYTVYNPN